MAAVVVAVVAVVVAVAVAVAGMSMIWVMLPRHLLLASPRVSCWHPVSRRE
jgi:hypothetical protein